MNALLVYVAAPYDDAGYVRLSVHPMLRELGMRPTSRWAEKAAGPEDFKRMSLDAIRRAAHENDADLRGSDVLLLVDTDGSGRETYAEARVALEWSKPVVWVGPPRLSAFRRGVVRVASLDEALRVLSRMREQHAEGYRGELLAHLADSAIEAALGGAP